MRGLQGSAFVEARWDTWCEAMGMKVVFIMVGTNDLNVASPAEQDRLDLQADITTIVEGLVAASILPVVMNIVPREKLIGKLIPRDRASVARGRGVYSFFRATSVSTCRNWLSTDRNPVASRLTRIPTCCLSVGFS